MIDWDSLESRKLDQEAARAAIQDSVEQILKLPREHIQVVLAAKIGEDCARELASATNFDVDNERYGLMRAFCALLCHTAKRTEWAMRVKTELAKQLIEKK